MPLYTHIIAAYDFPDASKRALTRAATMAQKNQGKLTIINTIHSDMSQVIGVGTPEQFVKLVAESIQKDVTEILTKDKLSQVPFAVKVAIGIPYKQIVKCALDEKADLICIGSNSRSSLGYMLLGSVADKVVRFSPVPVYITRLNDVSGNSVLVPIDHTDELNHAIEVAQEFAFERQGQIQLMHVVDVKDYEYTTGLDLTKTAMERAQVWITSLQSKLPKAKVPLVEIGNISDTILHHINHDKTISLVVTTTHGRKGWQRFLLGSTAEALVRYAHVDVLTLPLAQSQESLAQLTESLKD